ncbi:MAG TPA: substrate-binding domain-containing protein [Epulopiscium sp.]|nr:substrate-binding domain-containing protein [Candidatus Epulonipiscium sp.]
MRKNITLKDIAQKLQISSVTVSKALNDKDGVSEELRQKIKDLANEMGYRINTVARSMKEGCSYNIGIVIPDRFTGGVQSFYLNFYQSVSKVLEQYDYYGILQLLSKEDEEDLILPRIYNENRVDGLIVLGQVSRNYVKTLQNMEIPVVFLDFYDEHLDMDSVITDNFYGSYRITNYLMNSGHREIGFVGDIYATSSIQDRFLGYYKSLLEHKIELKQEFIIKDRDEHGKYIELEFPEHMPTAFVCNCDQIAYDVIEKLKKMDYDVPGDISVVGFDNDIYATISSPQITTIEVDTEEMAATAVEYILEKIKNNEREYGRVSIKGRIIYRESVKEI